MNEFEIHIDIINKVNSLKNIDLHNIFSISYNIFNVIYV